MVRWGGGKKRRRWDVEREKDGWRRGIRIGRKEMKRRE